MADNLDLVKERQDLSEKDPEQLDKVTSLHDSINIDLDEVTPRKYVGSLYANSLITGQDTLKHAKQHGIKLSEIVSRESKIQLSKRLSKAQNSDSAVSDNPTSEILTSKVHRSVVRPDDSVLSKLAQLSQKDKTQPASKSAHISHAFPAPQRISNAIFIVLNNEYLRKKNQQRMEQAI